MTPGKAAAAGLTTWPAACAALLLLAACGGSAPGTHDASAAGTPEGVRDAGPASLVLLTIDTLRADHLGCYGYFRDTSPFVDALARESVVFDRCYSPIATTLPAHVSLLTGVQPLEHGIVSNFKHGAQPFRPGSGRRSVAQVAAEQGFRTAAFVSATPLKRATGIDAGFATFDEPAATERRAGETVGRALGWLRTAEAGTPVFVWIHLFDPHRDYAAPAPFDTLFSTDAALERHLAERRFARSAPYVTGDVLDTREAVNGYDGEVRYMDGAVEQLVTGLKEIGLWDRALFVLVGDHGEGLGQHGEGGHGNIHGEQLRVPLVVHAPGLAPGRSGVVTGLVDVLPTVLPLLGPTADWSGFLRQASGSNVLAPAARERVAFGQRTGRTRSDLQGTAFAVTTAEWKFVAESGTDERLFHLPTDPFELADVAAAHPDARAALRARLAEELKRQRARGAALAAGEEPGTELPAGHRDELRSLGYVQ